MACDMRATVQTRAKTEVLDELFTLERIAELAPKFAKAHLGSELSAKASATYVEFQSMNYTTYLSVNGSLDVRSKNYLSRGEQKAERGQIEAYKEKFVAYLELLKGKNFQAKILATASTAGKVVDAKTNPQTGILRIEVEI